MMQKAQKCGLCKSGNVFLPLGNVEAAAREEQGCGNRECHGHLGTPEQPGWKWLLVCINILGWKPGILWEVFLLHSGNPSVTLQPLEAFPSWNRLAGCQCCGVPQVPLGFWVPYSLRIVLSLLKTPLTLFQRSQQHFQLLLFGTDLSFPKFQLCWTEGVFLMEYCEEKLGECVMQLWNGCTSSRKFRTCFELKSYLKISKQASPDGTAINQECVLCF